MPKELEYPDFPEQTEYLWRWFLELHMDRSFGEFGPNVVSYRDIKAWAGLTQRMPTANEVDAIKRLDHLYLRTSSGNY